PCMFVSILLAAVVLSAEPSKAQRPFHEYQREISELLTRHSQAKTPSAKAAAVRALCAMHHQLVSDGRYAASDALKEYRSRVWSRLTQAKAQIERQLAREGRASADAAAIAAANADQAAAVASLGESLALLDQIQGGPGQWMGLGGGAVAPDYGPALVELIERT